MTLARLAKMRTRSVSSPGQVENKPRASRERASSKPRASPEQAESKGKPRASDLCFFKKSSIVVNEELGPQPTLDNVPFASCLVEEHWSGGVTYVLEQESLRFI